MSLVFLNYCAVLSCSPCRLQSQRLGINITVKVAVTREVEKRLKKKSEIAKDFGIPLNTLSTYLKNKENILSEECESGKTQKRVRGPDNLMWSIVFLNGLGKRLTKKLL